MHTSEEFSGTERFRDVVVCAKLEQHHLLYFVRQRTQYDNRKVRCFLFDSATNLTTMHLRKFEIQDDDVRRRSADRRKPRGTVGSEVDGISLAFKDVFQGFVQRAVIFNDQHSLGRTHRRTSAQNLVLLGGEV